MISHLYFYRWWLGGDEKHALAMRTLRRQIPIFLIISQFSLSTSFPSSPTNTYSSNNIQRIFWPFTNSDSFLEMFVNAHLPIDPVSFTETVERALYAVDLSLRD